VHLDLLVIEDPPANCTARLQDVLGRKQQPEYDRRCPMLPCLYGRTDTLEVTGGIYIRGKSSLCQFDK
jgi:hypothetical protein